MLRLQRTCAALAVEARRLSHGCDPLRRRRSHKRATSVEAGHSSGQRRVSPCIPTTETNFMGAQGSAGVAALLPSLKLWPNGGRTARTGREAAPCAECPGSFANHRARSTFQIDDLRLTRRRCLVVHGNKNLVTAVITVFPRHGASSFRKSSTSGGERHGFRPLDLLVRMLQARLQEVPREVELPLPSTPTACPYSVAGRPCVAVARGAGSSPGVRVCLWQAVPSPLATSANRPSRPPPSCGEDP